ncbi:response regulator [Natronoglycomyces albus]|uniref:Response regulator transcription factor n=1 Tax=Natronoglycomyces albus TaxID=2811108 RepID=A0A895XKX0_9ACTN|nr:response regulator transcription factor [Natronoglycomyces albus]QSB04452.1 response regulator transcription factor [Natronoglycomyces albus]
MPIRVLIADDQAMVRAGFRSVLESQPDIDVVAEAADGVEAVALARQHRPDVCLFDIRMPRQDGLHATRLLMGPQASHPAKIVIVTTYDTDEYVYEALESGATGFLLKDSGPTLLLEAVRAAASGEAMVSPAVTVRLLKHMTRRPNTAQWKKAGLTERELDVIELVARGKTNPEIAAELHLSLSTVKTHLESIKLKISTRNRVEIAAWAWKNGVVD